MTAAEVIAWELWLLKWGAVYVLVLVAVVVVLFVVAPLWEPDPRRTYRR